MTHLSFGPTFLRILNPSSMDSTSNANISSQLLFDDRMGASKPSFGKEIQIKIDLFRNRRMAKLRFLKKPIAIKAFSNIVMAIL